MPTRGNLSLVRLGAALTVVLVVAGCTPGGQFDPTELLNSETLSTKKKLQGDREPLFPNGVPGAESGVPQELVKGYQAPPEPAPATPDAASNAADAQAKAEQKPKHKAKPKPKVATAPGTAPRDSAPRAAQPQSAWPSPQGAQPGQTAWPNPPQTAPGQPSAQPTQPAWPNPPSAATH
jgi:hypothetical protein